MRATVQTLATALVLLGQSTLSAQQLPISQLSRDSLLALERRDVSNEVFSPRRLADYRPPGVLAEGAYTPDARERQWLNDASLLAAVLAASTANSADMTNHGLFRRLAQKIVDLTPTVMSGVALYQLAQQIRDPERGSGRVGFSVGVGAGAKVIDGAWLEDIADEARFVVEAGDRFKLLLPATDSLAMNAERMAAAPNFPSREQYEADLREMRTRLIAVSSAQLEIIAILPAAYVASANGERARRIERAARRVVAAELSR